MRPRRTTFAGAAAVLATVSVLALAGQGTASSVPAARTAGPSYTTVAVNLRNPRQIRFSSTGAMYVAEAGTGGRRPCFLGDHFLDHQGATVCYGATGSVTRVFDGHQRRVLTGIASLSAQADGSSAIGPCDLAVHGHTLVLSVGLGAMPSRRHQLPRTGRDEMASLLSFDLTTGRRTDLGDIGGHEAAADPVDSPDTNPTGVAPAGKLGYLVTDSGGNTLLRVAARHVHGMATFHDRTAAGKTYQSVPTDVALGPDGAWYVSELTGTRNGKGLARIWRVVPGHRPTVWASGLTDVTSLAWLHGSLYVVQFSDTGISSGDFGSLRLVHSDKSGKPDVTVLGNLFAPYGLAIRRGAAYVSIGSIDPSGGSVIRIPL